MNFIKILSCGQIENAGIQYFMDECSLHCLFILSGSHMVLRINQKKYSMRPLMFMCIPFETGKITLETRKSVCYRYLHVQCTEQSLTIFSVHKLNFFEMYTLAEPLLIEEIWKLLSGFSSPQGISHSDQTFQNALQLLLSLFFESTNGAIAQASEIPYYNKLADLRHEIYDFPSRKWYIQDICDYFGISKSYFHKLYVSAFGTTCTQDVIMSRIACAKRLLETTDHAVSVIAQQCGFETDVYFMRQFKRHVGMTPTAYRRIFSEK